MSDKKYWQSGKVLEAPAILDGSLSCCGIELSKTKALDRRIDLCHRFNRVGKCAVQACRVVIYCPVRHNRIDLPCPNWIKPVAYGE